ncbi:MAG: hypothetical protein OXU20_40280 [Myxococcales bacterium]|nr:hypothetical protein [Myxococcales bacterium]
MRTTSHLTTSWPSVLLVLASIGVLWACGDDGDGAPQLAPTDRGRSDGGQVDRDPLPPRPDQRDPDPEPTGAPEEGLEGNCAVDSNKIFQLAMVDDAPNVTPLAVDRLQSRFGYAFVNEGGGCSDALMLAMASDSPQSLEPPMNDMAVDLCSLMSSPAVEHAGEDDWLLAFVDNREGYHVWVHRFDYHDASVSDGAKISQAAGPKGDVTIARVDADRTIVVWTEEQPDFSQTLKARAVDLAGEPIAQEHELVSGSAVDSVMLARLGTGEDGLPDPTVGLVYHTTGPTGSRAELQILDTDGAPVGSAKVLTSDAGELGTVGIAHNRQQEVRRDVAAGALVYVVTVGGSGRQLWAQLVDEQGEPAQLLDATGRPRGPAPPKRLVNAPLRAIDASITRMPTGYAVAYRALPGGPVTRPTIRVLFLDRAGEIIGDSDVGYTTELGGVTSIKMASNGRIVIGWSEYDGAGKATIKIASLPCAN